MRKETTKSFIPEMLSEWLPIYFAKIVNFILFLLVCSTPSLQILLWVFRREGNAAVKSRVIFHENPSGTSSIMHLWSAAVIPIPKTP